MITLRNAVAVAFCAMSLAAWCWWGMTASRQIRAYLARRRQTKARRAQLARWQRRVRGTVRLVKPRYNPDDDQLPPLKPGNLVVGYAVANGAVVLIEVPPAIPQVYVGPDGVPVYGGWSEAELIEIAARPAEFVSDLQK